MNPVTPEQLDALINLANGMSDPQSAKSLGICDRSLELRMQRVMLKLGAKNRAHAVALAFRQGLLTKAMVNEVTP